MNSIKQGTIIYIDFDPSKGSEIKKRRPAVVIIVCPITSTDKKRPYFVEIDNDALKKGSMVNAKQVYTLVFTERGGRNIEILGEVSTREFINIAQHVQMNFNFPV